MTDLLLAAELSAAGVGSVLHVNDKGGSFGGTEQYIASVAAGLAEAGVANHLAYGELSGPTAPHLSHFRIDGLASRTPDPDAPAQLVELARRARPDLVYVHNVFDHRLIEALDPPGRRHLLIWYVHDHYLTCLAELRTIRSGGRHAECALPLSNGCLTHMSVGNCWRRSDEAAAPSLSDREALLRSARRADALVVVSAYMRRSLEAQPALRGSPVYALPRHIEAPPPDGAPPADRGRTLLFAGRIASMKGLHLAIDAAARVGGAELLVAGPVEDEDYWRRCLAQAEETRRRDPSFAMTYLGRLGARELGALYARAAVTIVPSIWAEPLGVVPAEAVTRGSAVAAFDRGGLSTWFESGATGLLVDPVDPGALALAVRTLLDDEAFRRAAVERGARLVRERHSTTAHLEALGRVCLAARANRAAPAPAP